ncbi:glycosyltransferase family 2 protein [Flavivirga aquimarina]|uniref:Glycosyltransferase family 2 protein n=1 Tax=Flavivirga aquimarina TaxID=2027862 RepID=A0ABT8WBM5_9FLAO|nr:glycosyltransferase family 2 protein [Flavivirga aquimarina]MDO5970549.1 glycosyltransferase family 2 protein [Flavivirga aquimarina]
MKFSLIICTYMREESLHKLLLSVNKQNLYPNEILVIDGSTNDNTKNLVAATLLKNLKYFKVEEKDRGLTKQRNFGINLVAENSEVVCFLDDDTELEVDYFKQVIETFIKDDKVIGVGGVSVNENRWFKPKKISKLNKKKFYIIDGFAVKEGLRNVVRNYLGLNSRLLPGVMPEFSNGRTNGYPLNNKIYKVDLLIGMSFSFRKTLFNKIKFSTYFEGYGLYEDADFSLRALNYGKNVINTSAKINHYHDASGRPNKYKYGKMVIRNGWYVWRVKYPKPKLKARIKWNAIAFLLTLIRFANIINTNKKREAFTEGLGRVVGWFSLFFNRPKVQS